MTSPIAMLEGWALADLEQLVDNLGLAWASESALLKPDDDLILMTVTGFEGTVIHGISPRGLSFVHDVTVGFELRPVYVDSIIPRT